MNKEEKLRKLIREEIMKSFDYIRSVPTDKKK